MPRPVVARFEVTAKNSTELRRFYSDLFEWNIEEGAKGSGFHVIPPAEGGISGVIGPDRSGGLGHVTFYVEVDDVAAYLVRAEKVGGRTLVPPTEVAEFGLTFAFFADPEGHVVGLSRGVLS